MRTESSYEDFEYDNENMEADDEADDEASFEADDEADDEASFEADDEADDEASFEADDEADDEASFEADDEADDESTVMATARTPTARARSAQLAFQRRLVAQQRVEAKQVAATRRNITERIRNIPAQAKTVNAGALQGSNVFVARLPTGRTTKLALSPAPATARDVNRLRTVLNSNDQRQAKAIAKLSAAQTAFVTKVTSQLVQSDNALSKKLVEGDKLVSARFTKELSAQRNALAKQRKRMMTLLKRQRQRSTWNSLLIASSLPFFAAYGDRANPFSRKNLILTGSLGGWLVGDELMDQFLSRGKSGKSWSGGANTWSYVAPLGNAATVWYLLSDSQHERFVTGVAEFTGDTGSVAIKDKIGKDSLDDFLKISQPTVVATLVSNSAGTETAVKAQVVAGQLTLTLDPALTGTNKVAFMIDTQAVST